MRKTILTLIWSVAMMRVFAQQAPPANATAHSFSLQDCINYAYEHQDSVKNAALDIKKAEYKVKETIGIGLPQISGTAQFQDYLKLPVTLVDISTFDKTVPAGTLAPFQFGLNYTSSLSADINQIIFSGSYLVGLQASKTYKQLSQRAFTRSKIETNVNVTKAYYQVLVSNEQIRLLDANIKQLKEQYDQTAAQNKQGFVEKIDVQRLEVQYNNLLTSRENTVRLLVLNYQLLKFQMGMSISEELTLVDKLENIKLEEDMTKGAVDTAFYHNRIEYNLAETSLELNKLDVKNKKAAFMPTLSAFGNTGLSYQANRFSDLYNKSFPSTYVGLRLNVPIFSGGQRINQLRQSKVEVEKSRNDLEQIKNALSLQANQASIMYSNGLRSLANQKKNQELAKEVLRVSRIKYQQGVGSSIEVTQAETDLQNADNKYIQGLYDALVSKVDLDKAYGRIQ